MTPALDPLDWLALAALLALLAFPVAWFAGRVAARSGRSPLWGLLVLLPVLNLVLVWRFAFVRWPALEAGDRRTPLRACATRADLAPADRGAV